MENTLRQLQELQMEALQNGIAYDLDIYQNEEGPDIKVKMYYTSVSDVSVDNRTFSTVLSTDDSLIDIKLESIKKFIDSIKK